LFLQPDVLRRSDLLKTLHWFLARELAKVTLLSLVAFTLVMTVFAIIEPMRKQGLSTDQVISFLGYTLPAMVSLTLPIAALFGATIVYGRFSQDNELQACRAGGISTVRLLEPAMVLGVLVTAASLWLSNTVTPQLAKKAEQTIKGNIRQIAYYQLRTQGTLRYANYMLHADRVEAAHDMLYGVVLSVTRPPREANAPVGTDANAPRDPNLAPRPEVTLVACDRASISFPEFEGETYVSFRAEEPVETRSTEFNILRVDQPPPYSFPLPDPVRDNPAWYSWDQLVETLRNPVRNRTIERSLRGLCADLGCEMLAAEVVATVRTGQPYAKLHGRSGAVELLAPRAEQRPLEAELLAQTGPGGVRRPVVIRIIGEREIRVLEADRCRVRAGTSLFHRGSVVSLEIDGDIRVRSLPRRAASGSAPASGGAASAASPADEGTLRQNARIGDLEMPEDLVKMTDRIDPNLMLASVPQMSSDPAVLRRFHFTADVEIPHLQGRLQAEMHGRLAYGLSCLLMVAMGAALGLMFRGGQLLSAFVLSVIPAAIVILLILSGKQMLGNLGVPRVYGLSAVWGGIGALIAGNLGLYVHLARK
jgi:lipopolysaccharide export system permease protein